MNRINFVRSLYLFLFCILTFNCSSKENQDLYSKEFTINRFDQELFAFLNDPENSTFLSDNYSFLKEYGNKVIYVGAPDSIGFESRLRNFFSESTLMNLYKDEQSKFQNIDIINEELAKGFISFFESFPLIKKPSIYMHVSGLNQNVIVSDEVLSISADKYLGTDYPLYQDYFYEYQRQLMAPDRIVPDYLLGFMYANLPFEGNDEVLLDRMLYEGKIRYILSVLLPDRNSWEFVGYNKEQYEWCEQYESEIWKYILENKHLFEPDYRITQQYIREAPYTTLLPSESPGRVGVWTGYRIISSYMKRNPSVTLSRLMEQTDYQEILKSSKYKP